MKLQVTVNKLNRRKSPVTDFANKSNVVEVVSNGFTFESVAQIENNLGIWHQDRDGFWAWENGLSAEESLQINYNQQIQNIPDKWKTTVGEGIIVAILDTGLSSSFQSNFNIIKGYNAITNVEDEFEDNFGHGTFVAGIIAGNSENIKGIAPNVKLIIVKIADHFFDTDFAARGIKWLDERCPVKPDIINISADFPASTNADFFASKFTLFNQKGIFVFAAAEDDSKLFGNDLFFPASEPNVYAVGKLNADIVNQGEINDKIEFICGDIKFKSVNEFTPTNGSSYSTASVSGAVALGLASHDLEQSNLTRKDYIDQQIQRFSAATFDNALKIFRL